MNTGDIAPSSFEIDASIFSNLGSFCLSSIFKSSISFTKETFLSDKFSWFSFCVSSSIDNWFFLSFKKTNCCSDFERFAPLE